VTAHDSPAARPAVSDVPDARERPIGELVKELASQTSTLVRQEIALAQAEVTQKGKLAGKGAGMLAGAAAAGLLALGTLTALLIVVLDSFLELWIAAAIVLVLWAIVALVLARAGQAALKQATPPAPQTVETVKEDIQWAKTQTGSAGR
jgi:type IV secretory pathway TrbD component